MDEWIISENYMEFEGINLFVMVDEERGNYEMSIIMPFLDNINYLLQLGRKFWDAEFTFHESNNFYYLKDKENNYVIDRNTKCANLTFSREDRKGFLLEEDIEELFDSYRKVKEMVKISDHDFNGLDDYLLNFGYDDLIKGKTDNPSYERGFESQFKLQKEYVEGAERDIFAEIDRIMKTPLTYEETIDFMLEGISELKKNVKKGNNKGIEYSKQRIEHYAKKLDYESTEMLEKIINKKRLN